MAELDAQPSKCLVCKVPIADRAVVRCYLGDRVELHEACWEKILARHLERRAFAEDRVAAVLASLPKFTVAVRSAEFLQRVKNPRLIAAAEGYGVERGSVAILGPAGCGKTITLASIVHRLCAEAVAAYVGPSAERDFSKLDAAARIYWVTAAELCSARRQHRLGEGEAPAFRRAELAPVLFLDEIGQEMADDRWLLELLDARYASALPTLSTSGLTRLEIEGRYGAGTTRRLIEPKGQFLDVFREGKGG